jgi:hypothetical protein
MTLRAPWMISLACAVALATVAAVDDASAATYPTNKCVSAKLKEAGKKCQGLLKAWSTWDKTQNAGKLALKLGQVSSKFQAKWTNADTKAAQKGAECADTTIDVAGAEQLIDDAVDAVVNAVNAGLTLTPPPTADGKCGAKLLNEAAKKCDGLLKAYSKFIKQPPKDPQRAKLGQANAKVVGKFTLKFGQNLASCPNTTATTAGVEAIIDDLRDDLVEATTISPNVSDTQFDTISHPPVGQPGHAITYDGQTIRPRCQDFSQYHFFVKRGTENKLLMYYQGGGVCWSGATCCLNTCDQDVNPAGSDNPNNSFQSGFADLNNPDNPFRNWHVVFVAYCSCDIHTGDNGLSYGGPICNLLAGTSSKAVEHRGFHNAKLAEKFAREHFLDPEEVYATGSSAGAFGAQTHITPLARIYAASNVNMLADAGTFKPIQGFVDHAFTRWGLTNNFTSLKVPGIDLATVTSTDILEKSVQGIARHFPGVNLANYVTGHDGSTGGLGGFYHVMVNHPYPGEPDVATVTGTWPRWWDSTCAYNQIANTQTAAIEAVTSTENDNYRAYVGSGTRHTMFGHNKVYDDMLGGVEPVVDFINKQRIKPTDPSWTSQIASPQNVLVKQCVGGTNKNESCPNGLTDCPDQSGGTSCAQGDPRPSPLQCPFTTVGDDVVIDCTTPCP